MFNLKKQKLYNCTHHIFYFLMSTQKQLRAKSFSITKPKKDIIKNLKQLKTLIKNERQNKQDTSKVPNNLWKYKYRMGSFIKHENIIKKKRLRTKIKSLAMKIGNSIERKLINTDHQKNIKNQNFFDIKPKDDDLFKKFQQRQMKKLDNIRKSLTRTKFNNLYTKKDKKFFKLVETRNKKVIDLKSQDYHKGMANYREGPNGAIIMKTGTKNFENEKNGLETNFIIKDQYSFRKSEDFTENSSKFSKKEAISKPLGYKLKLKELKNLKQKKSENEKNSELFESIKFKQMSTSPNGNGDSGFKELYNKSKNYSFFNVPKRDVIRNFKFNTKDKKINSPKNSEIYLKRRVNKNKKNGNKKKKVKALKIDYNQQLDWDNLTLGSWVQQRSNHFDNSLSHTWMKGELKDSKLNF